MPEPLSNPVVPDAPEEAQVPAPSQPEGRAPTPVIQENGRATRELVDNKVLDWRKRAETKTGRPFQGPQGEFKILRRPPKTAPVSRDHPYVIKADPNGPFPECFAVLGRHQWVKYRLPRTPWLGSRTGHLYRFVYNKITKDRKKILWLHRLVAHCPKNRFVSFQNRDER